MLKRSIANRVTGLFLLAFFVWVFSPLLSAQPVVRYGLFNPYNPSEALRMTDNSSGFAIPQPKPVGPPLVSADFLRHPLEPNLARKLEDIQRVGLAGKHTQALAELQTALVKHPKAWPYIYNLLGIEYVAVRDFKAASSAFERVLKAMPHTSANYSNLGYSVAALGEMDRAQQLLRTALALDDHNQKARELLSELRNSQTADTVAKAKE